MSQSVNIPAIKGQNKNCELCSSRASMYTCPRCSIHYCSSNCYKSEEHSECSESFYQQCIIDELKSQEQNPEDRKKMLNILKRLHEEEQLDNVLEDMSNEDDELDSDDDENIPDLGSRIQNVNLDNADEVWSVLTDAEKQEFEALIKNGEAEKLLPQWIPWWECHARKKLVEELDSKEENVDYAEECPAIIEIPIFSELSKASPNVRFNLINVLHAYAYIAMYYNGDYLNCAKEAANLFFDICENMKNNKVFSDSTSAVESVVQCILNHKLLPKDKEMIAKVHEVGTSIIQGPEKGSSLYILAALSELHRLFETTKKEIIKTKCKDKNNGQKFAQKFEENNIDQTLSKREIVLCLKKLEYYLSWVKSYGSNLCA